MSNFVALATWPHNTCINPSWWAAAVAASSVALLSWCWPPFIHQLSINRSVWGSLFGSVWVCGGFCGVRCRALCGSAWFCVGHQCTGFQRAQCPSWPGSACTEGTMSIRGSSGGRDLKAHLPSQQSTIASHPRSTIASQCRHSPLIICSYWS